MAEFLTARVLEPNPQVSKPSDEITYALMVNFRQGPQIIRGIKPSDARPDPLILDTLSVAPNSVVFGSIESNMMYWRFNEQPDTAPCEPAPGDAT